MEAFAAESGGMPQLNPEFWVSQIFWLIITFGILYLVLSKLILPKISINLELRKSQGYNFIAFSVDFRMLDVMARTPFYND